MPERPDPYAHPSLPEKVLSGLARLNVALKADAWSRTSEEGLNPTQAHILAALKAGPSSPTLTDLAARLGATKATVSDSVASLEAKGLLRKRPSAADARRLELGLTSAGRKLARKLSAWPGELLAGAGILAPEEQARLLGLLSKLILGMQEQGRIAPSRICASCRWFQRDRHPGARKPHHCGLVDAPMGDADLRLDCPEHAARG